MYILFIFVFIYPGATCTDPGTEAGTIQNSPTTYEPGETVTYECIQDGFALNGPSTLECAIVDSIPKWNGDPPTCSGDLSIVNNEKS